MDILYDIIYLLFVALIIKSVFVGSEFSFYAWGTHGRKYTNWYFNKEQWRDFSRKSTF